MSSESLHEDAETLGPAVVDQHRAIVSIMEELEAVDWYNQRAKATNDQQLRAVLEHNRDEEKEHAAMAIEWLRRSDPTLSRHLRTYLFTEGSITNIEAVTEHGASPPNGGGAGEADDGEEGVSEDGSLGIGSLVPAKEAKGAK
jgi:ferritin-like protein